MPAPTTTKRKPRYALRQRVGFTSIPTPAEYSGGVKALVEVGYAVSIGLHDTHEYCEGCSVASTATAAPTRRSGAGVEVSFEASMPEERVDAAEAISAQLEAQPAKLAQAMDEVAQVQAAAAADPTVPVVAVPVVGAIETPAPVVQQQQQQQQQQPAEVPNGEFEVPSLESSGSSGRQAQRKKKGDGDDGKGLLDEWLLLVGMAAAVAGLCLLTALWVACGGSFTGGCCSSSCVTPTSGGYGAGVDVELGVNTSVKMFQMTHQAGIEKINAILSDSHHHPAAAAAARFTAGSILRPTNPSAVLPGFTATSASMGSPPPSYKTAADLARSRRIAEIPEMRTPSREIHAEYDRARRADERKLRMHQAANKAAEQARALTAAIMQRKEDAGEEAAKQGKEDRVRSERVTRLGIYL